MSSPSSKRLTTIPFFSNNSVFMQRLLWPHCNKELFRRSFPPTVITLHNDFIYLTSTKNCFDLTYGIWGLIKYYFCSHSADWFSVSYVMFHQSSVPTFLTLPYDISFKIEHIVFKTLTFAVSTFDTF